MELITGKKFSELADNQRIYYSKIDHVDDFFRSRRPSHPYILITHNGDLPVSSRHLPYLEDSSLIRWYGQNIAVCHPKLKSIPIGIPNPEWIRESIYLEIPLDLPRTNLIHFGSFAKDNNRAERSACEAALNRFGYQMAERTGIVELLHEYKKAFFVPAPDGNGIDTHRLWECLYMGAIPIVTQSINSHFYRDLPIYFLDKWEDFDASVFTENLYRVMWKHHSHEQLDFNYWKKLIQG